jgi:hypothetical protein
MKSFEDGGKLDYLNFGHTQRYYQIRSRVLKAMYLMIPAVYAGFGVRSTKYSHQITSNFWFEKIHFKTTALTT